jgi:DHA2 family multidrug resistance protein-like MFS transporter
VIGSNVAPKFIHKYKPGLILGLAFAASAVGLALLAQANGLALVVIANIIISLALAPAFSLTTELIVSSAPPEKAGAASGISETGAELGGALGISILGSIGTAIYRAELAERLPAAIPAEIADAARDTLGAAVEAAGQLSEEMSQTLLAIARDAFVQGLHLTALIAAIVAIGAAVMVISLLNRTSARTTERKATELSYED